MADLTRRGHGRGEVMGRFDENVTNPHYRSLDLPHYYATAYIASDLARLPGVDPVFVTATQVHETGNALAHLTGRSGRGTLSWVMVAHDPDDGIALENCVFGGKVTLGGRVTQNPR